MKILVFNSSPKSERGNTHVMVEAFLDGARETGAECETVFLAKKKIHPCLGCFVCWEKTPGICAIKDDMQELLKKRMTADIIVYATPLYVDNVSGIMKNFMDRSIPVSDPHFEKDENGQTRHVERKKHDFKIAVISNCGYPEQEQFEALRVLFRRIARNEHSPLIAEIYRGEGPLLTSDDEGIKPLVEGYKRLLRKAGREVATKFRLSEETAAELEKPLVPYEDYVKGANESWSV